MPRSLSPFAADVEVSLRRWRERLEDEQRFRTEQIAILTDETTEHPHLHRDEVSMALRYAATVALKEVEAALTRMDTDRYGSCTSCAQPIPTERLDALPMAALCMPCQYREHSRRG